MTTSSFFTKICKKSWLWFLSILLKVLIVNHLHLFQDSIGGGSNNNNNNNNNNIIITTHCTAFVTTKITNTVTFPQHSYSSYSSSSSWPPSPSPVQSKSIVQSKSKSKSLQFSSQLKVHIHNDKQPSFTTTTCQNNKDKHKSNHHDNQDNKNMVITTKKEQQHIMNKNRILVTILFMTFTTFYNCIPKPIIANAEGGEMDTIQSNASSGHGGATVQNVVDPLATFGYTLNTMDFRTSTFNNDNNNNSNSNSNNDNNNSITNDLTFMNMNNNHKNEQQPTKNLSDVIEEKKKEKSIDPRTHG